MSGAANGPLVSPDTVPSWLRSLVEVSMRLDSSMFTHFAPPQGTQVRPASVLILFGHGEFGPDVLLLRRATTLDSHAGQVAFPGGGAEQPDSGPVDTALREATEETGVVRSGVRPIALLPDLYIPISDYSVTPVVAHWAEPSPVHAVDLGETSAVARVPVSELVDPANRFQVRRSDGKWQGPAFRVGDMFVWGFTAGLLSVLFGLAGWERGWDRNDVRDLDVALAEQDEWDRAAGREQA